MPVINYYEKLEVLETKLDSRFFRCHRSYLVNLQYLQSCRLGFAALSTGEEIPVSRLRREQLSAAVLQYMKQWRPAL
jgi:DNA-binding LytR/AlgR family response regulator